MYACWEPLSQSSLAAALQVSRSSAQGKLNVEMDKIKQMMVNEKAQPVYIEGLQDFFRSFTVTGLLFTW